MGNKCCSCKRQKEGPDTSNPALQAIREAQSRYFNSHIEEDDSDEEDEEDKEDSVDDAFGSECSLDLIDSDSIDRVVGSNQDGFILVDTGDAPDSSRRGSGDESLNNGMMTSTEGQVKSCDADIVKSTTTNRSSNGTKKAKVVKRKEKAKHIRLSKRGQFYSILNMEDKRARAVDPRMYVYPFENIVFEGGGNKGLAYCGAVRLLEEVGVWPQIKRLGGASAGAMTAALLAVGYDSYDLEAFFSLNLNKIFLDHRFGYFSLLPNLLSSYGWNPGNKIYKWFGQKMAEKTNNPDVTFREVYEMGGKELCIVVTNLNQMTSTYCHPKTTPDMPVRLAVRMSISIPGMFQAVKHTLHDQTDIFVDGGVLCNYPVHCFDGWWLSMKPEDNFLEKLQPLEDIPRLLERTERFGVYNEKTLGMQLYSDNEQDLLKYQLENLRHGVQLQELPNTKLAREKIKKKKLQLKTDREHRRLVKAMNAFLKALTKHNADKNDNIDREELECALNDEENFPRKKRLILFGDVSSDIILDYLDRDHNGQISFNELVHFMEETGINMQNRFLGYQRRNIRNFPTFLDTLQATLLTNVKRVYVEERDLKRTVGINTGHVGTSDFALEPGDIEFILERGRRSLEAFLKYYVASKSLKKKPEYRRLNVDVRKDSKASMLSTVTSISADSVSTQGAASADDGTLRVRDSQQHRHSGIAVDLIPTASSNENGNNSKSTSSGRSVQISTTVDVIDCPQRYSTNVEECSESAGLLAKEDGDVSRTDEASLSGASSRRPDARISRNVKPLSLKDDDEKVLKCHGDVESPKTPLLLAVDAGESFELKATE